MYKRKIIFFFQEKNLKLILKAIISVNKVINYQKINAHNW